MRLEINEQEKDLLVEILGTSHKLLLDEILHTDGFEYRELLKQKLELLKELESRVAVISDSGASIAQ